MNKLPVGARAKILELLCEGMSMRSIERVVGCSINTVDKLLRDAGEAALAYHDRTVRGVKANRIQCDEIPPPSCHNPNIWGGDDARASPERLSDRAVGRVERYGRCLEITQNGTRRSLS